MWKIISRKEDKVTVMNMKIFLCAIMNFNFEWMKVEDVQEDED
jgi:hypothetical protein